MKDFDKYILDYVKAKYQRVLSVSEPYMILNYVPLETGYKDQSSVLDMDDMIDMLETVFGISMECSMDVLDHWSSKLENDIYSVMSENECESCPSGEFYRYPSKVLKSIEKILQAHDVITRNLIGDNI